MNISALEKKEILRYLSYYDFTQYIRDKRILITGSQGIVGSGIVKWLLMENQIHGTNISIYGSTRNPSSIPSYIGPEDNIQYLSFGKEIKAVEGNRIDLIVHAASSTDNLYHKEHPLESFRINYDCTERMIEIAKDNPGCKMVYLSSEEVYGLPSDDSPEMNEKMVGAIDSLSIRSCYPLSKKASEFICYAAAIEYGIDVKIIRPTVITGLFQKYSDPRVVNQILRCVIENKNLEMKSNGLTKKCMVYSLDAIAGILTVLLKGEKGNAYNASNPDTFITIKDLAEHVFKRFAPMLSVEFAAKDDSVELGYLPHRTIIQDITKIKTLGWEPRTSLDEIYKIDIERFSSRSAQHACLESL